LMNAAFYGHEEIVELLVAAGVDLNAETPTGVTALKNAKAANNDDIIGMLEDAIEEAEATKPAEGGEGADGQQQAAAQ